MRVRVPKGLLQGFTTRAKRAYPKEYVELVYGKVVRNDYCIVAFVEPEQEATPHFVMWMEDEDADTLDDSPRSPILLGSIHSHPRETDASPSEFDWRRQSRSGDQIAGICAIWRKDEGQPLRSHVRFYVADALLDVERS